MIQYVIPMLEAWLPMWETYVIPCFCLCLVAFVGRFVHYLLRG